MNIKTYSITFVVFFIIDIIWLVFIAKNIYKDAIGHLMSDQPNWIAAILFYLIFIFGLVYFVIQPAVDLGTWKNALFNGMLFGLITYSTYDLTNLATLNNWPLNITIIDLIWGTSLGGMVSTITYFILSKK
ncbi:MAG: DUF2177 family protein [Clostridia bacterium]|nr:DUF2177 family protein [Clostridia bacterium]